MLAVALALAVVLAVALALALSVALASLPVLGFDACMNYPS